jgi:hypothetical protein
MHLVLKVEALAEEEMLVAEVMVKLNQAETAKAAAEAAAREDHLQEMADQEELVMLF